MRRTAPISRPSASPVTSEAAPRPVRRRALPGHATDASPSRGTRWRCRGVSPSAATRRPGVVPRPSSSRRRLKGHGGTEVFARAWRLGWDQFEDVMAQENGRATIPLDVEPAALVDGSSLLVGPGRYDRLVCVGILEGLPVLTFTAPASLESVHSGSTIARVPGPHHYRAARDLRPRRLRGRRLPRGCAWRDVRPRSCRSGSLRVAAAMRLIGPVERGSIAQEHPVEALPHRLRVPSRPMSMAMSIHIRTA